MNSTHVHAFAERLMRDVWEPFDLEQLSRFYHEDVIGHHRTQTLSYDDVVNRLVWDPKHSADPVFDIEDIIADEDRFSIRFILPRPKLHEAKVRGRSHLFLSPPEWKNQ